VPSDLKGKFDLRLTYDTKPFAMKTQPATLSLD